VIRVTFKSSLSLQKTAIIICHNKGRGTDWGGSWEQGAEGNVYSRGRALEESETKLHNKEFVQEWQINLSKKVSYKIFNIYTALQVTALRSHLQAIIGSTALYSKFLLLLWWRWPRRVETCILVHGAEPFLRSRQLCSYSRTSQHFTEPESSLPCSKKPSTGRYHEPDQSSLYHPIPSF
jgi:hypothetical protein